MSKKRQRSGDDQTSNKQLAELVAILRPLEELQGEKSSTGTLEGAMRVDESRLPVPDDIVESHSKRWLGIESVVVVIAGLMLAFIAFIAWQIWLMPGPGKP
jgi:hypothetical protein